MKKFILSLVLLLTPAVATAADYPNCSQKNVGVVQCMADRMCECKFFPKSEMAQTPDHFGWDCGLTRPTCLDYQNIETQRPYEGPNSVGFDKSSTVIH